MTTDAYVSAEFLAGRKSLVLAGRRMAVDRPAVQRRKYPACASARVLSHPHRRDVITDEIPEASICLLDRDGTVLAGDGREGPLSGRCTGRSTRAQRPEPWCTHTHRSPQPCRRCARIRPSTIRSCGPRRPHRAGCAVYDFRVRRPRGSGGCCAGGPDRRAPENHGAVVCGTSSREAYDRALLLEWLAEVYWRALLVGSPRILDAAELDRSARRPGDEVTSQEEPDDSRRAAVIVSLGRSIVDIPRPASHLRESHRARAAQLLDQVRIAGRRHRGQAPVSDLAKLGASSSPSAHRRQPARRFPDVGAAEVRHSTPHACSSRNTAFRPQRPCSPIRPNGKRPACTCPARRRCSRSPTSIWTPSPRPSVLHVGGPDVLGDSAGSRCAPF